MIGERVVHSDNLCTVGWTTIHGWFSPVDMRWLRAWCPKGYFKQTFLGGHHLIETAEEAKNYIEEENSKRPNGYQISRLGFYFDFPLDEKGKSLLEQFGFDPKKCRFYYRNGRV